MTLDRSTSRIQKMFAEIAPRYDFLNHVLSCGIDRRWRRRVVKTLAPTKDARILDICTGTGDLALEFHKRCGVQVTAADFCDEMLEIAREKAKKRGVAEHVTFQHEDAMRLSFPDDSFQYVTVAFGLRNIEDTRQGLSEMARVCTPGGKVAVLELSTPTMFPIRQLYHFYFRHILPRVGQLVAKNRQDAYNYLPASVGEFPQGSALTKMMEDAGLRETFYRPMTFGIATLYVGTK